MSTEDAAHKAAAEGRQVIGGMQQAVTLQRLADLVGLLDLMAAVGAHHGADMGPVFYIAEDLQAAQRLAHRRLAGAELGGDLQFLETLSRRQRAIDDALDEDTLDLGGKALTLNSYVFHGSWSLSIIDNFL